MSQSAILAELRSISASLKFREPYFENEKLSKASAVTSFGTTLEVAGQEFSQFIIRTDGEIDDISYRVKNLQGGFNEEVELVDIDVIPGPFDIIQFKNDVAESGKSIFVNKMRLPKQSPFFSGFHGGRSKVEPRLFNGVTHDAERNNHEVTVLTSAVRTATFNTADFPTFNARTVVVILDVTAVPTTDTIAIAIQGKDTLSDSYFTIETSAGNDAVGEHVIIIGQAQEWVASTLQAVFQNTALPAIIRGRLVHSGSGNFTYTLSFNFGG